MLTLHHLENSRSQRILWLLEELELEYEIKLYKRDSKTNLAPPELIEIHPLGKSPVITDGDLTIAESGAIIQYLLENHADGRFCPEMGTDAWREYTYWMHFAEGTLMPYLVFKLVFHKVETAPLPFFVKPIAKGISGKVNRTFIMPNIERNLAFIESSLEGKEWFVDDRLSGADFQMSFPLEAAAARANFDAHPNIKAYIKRFQARDAYKRALEKGGPYNLSMG